MDLDQAYKDNIERKILGEIADSLESNTLVQSELPAIAGFILDRIDNIKTHQELIAFLFELSSQWSIFKNLEDIERGEEKEQKEEEALKDVLELARTGKIDEAVGLAKESTGNNN